MHGRRSCKINFHLVGGKSVCDEHAAVRWEGEETEMGQVTNDMRMSEGMKNAFILVSEATSSYLLIYLPLPLSRFFLSIHFGVDNWKVLRPADLNAECKKGIFNFLVPLSAVSASAGELT